MKENEIFAEIYKKVVLENLENYIKGKSGLDGVMDKLKDNYKWHISNKYSYDPETWKNYEYIIQGKKFKYSHCTVNIYYNDRNINGTLSIIVVNSEISKHKGLKGRIKSAQMMVRNIKTHHEIKDKHKDLIKVLTYDLTLDEVLKMEANHIIG